MIGADAGKVEPVTARVNGRTLVRIRYECDSNGVARRSIGGLSGVLDRYTAIQEGGSGNYSVMVLDRFGSDVLDGTCGSLDYTGRPSGHISATLGSQGERPILVAGEHWFQVEGTASAEGVFELRLLDSVASRFEHAGLAR